MSIEIVIICDTTLELLTELSALMSALTSAPAATKKAARKTRPKAEPATEEKTDEPKADAEAEPEGEDKSDYERGFELVQEIYDNPDARNDVRRLLKDLGVKNFTELPKNRGGKLLKAARELEKKFPVKQEVA